MPPPAVQIVLPFHRAGHFLREAIESVLNQQDFDDWHLCLINDASDGLDVQIAHEYQRALPHRITLLQHGDKAPRGTSAARNLGILEAKSEFIAFLDADDSWYPGKLKLQVDLLNRHCGVDMLYGPALRWHGWNGGQDVEVPAAVDGFGAEGIVPGAALLATYLRDESLTPCTGSVLLRREAVMRAGCFEETFRGLYDDQVFYAKVCLASDIYVSSECVSRYRQHASSCCRQAEADNSGPAARQRFLAWLKEYMEARHLVPPPLALSSCEFLAT